MSDKQPEALRLAKISEDLAADGALLHCWPWPQLAKLYRDDAAELRRQHALIAELVEAAEAYLDAQGAVDNCELIGPNAPPYEELWRKRSMAYADFDAALSKAKEQ